MSAGDGTIDVERVGHVNQVASGYDDLVAAYRSVLGGAPFREWSQEEIGTKNALVTVSDTCVELFAADLGEGPTRTWLDRNGPGWHSIEWTVPSMDDAHDACLARGIRITELAPHYFFTHPRDCHGLNLEITSAHFADDPRDDPSVEPQPSFWRDEHPLGITGFAGVRVSAPDASAAADWLSGFTGTSPSAPVDLPGLAARAVPVELPGHTVWFAEPAGDGAMSSFVVQRGARLHAAVFRVADAARARDHLASIGVGVLPGGTASSLTIDPAALAGARFELTEG